MTGGLRDAYPDAVLRAGCSGNLTPALVLFAAFHGSAATAAFVLVALPAATTFSVVAGLCFGLFLICLAQIGKDAGLWAAPISRAASAGVLALVVVLARRPAEQPTPGTGRLILAIGALEVAAVCSLVLAFRNGTLAIPSVLASLYPVTTVLLAAFVLHERVSRLQLTAVLLALGAVVLISTG